MADRWRQASAALRRDIAAASDPRTWRYTCWLDKLDAGADDQLIQWHHICPAQTGALGAAYIVGPCDIGAGRPVDQAQLQAAIRSVADVEPANRNLGFITHARSDIVFAYEMTSPSVHLENLRLLHDDVIRALDKLEKWANNPMGGSSAMPPAYRSIKEWIRRRQSDPNSLYSCM
jgi:hypothetical protein